MQKTIVFGTDGWRGIIGDDFTFANVELVTTSIGQYIKETYKDSEKLPILIGYDTRFMADKFAAHAAQVIEQMGLTAKLSSHDVPTPCIAWAAHAEPSAGAMQFTASHNPSEYCGIKYITHFGGPATNDITEKIVAHFDKAGKAPQTVVPGAVSSFEKMFDAKAPYLMALKKLVDLKSIATAKLKVAYDPIYGTGRNYLDKLLEEAGLKVHVMHNFRDPLFGGGNPEPKAEYLKELISFVQKEHFDIGLATDGDADRFSAVDERGNYLSPNQLLCLLTKHLVKNKGLKGSIVRTVATTHLLNHLAFHYGLDVIETPVGFKYISEKMRQSDILIGGEESGGVSVKGHIPEKDGILANLLLVEMVACEGKPLSKIWQELQEDLHLELHYRRADFTFNADFPDKLFKKLIQDPFKNLGGKPVVRSSNLDGLKFYIDEDNWLLLRASGTEPLLRLYCEGTSAALADQVMLDCKEQLQILLNGGSNLKPVLTAH